MFKNFFKSYDFRRGLLLVFTILVCGLTLFILNFPDLIPGMAIGVLLTSICDLQGDFNKRVLAMLFSIVLNVFSFFMINMFLEQPFLLFPYLTITVFMISYIGVFGFRANMLAFSGLMGIVLSMVRKYEGTAIWEYIGLFIGGGLVYMLFSSIFHRLTKKSQVNEKLVALMNYTAEYLTLKFQTYQKGEDLDEERRLSKHQSITDMEEDLRQLLFTNEIFGGSSKTRNRQMLLLVEMIDVAELTSTNLMDIKTLRTKEYWSEDLFQPYLEIMSKQITWLKNLSAALGGANVDIKPPVTVAEIEYINQAIHEFAVFHGISKVREISIPLFNFKNYLIRQQSKLNAVYYLVKNKKSRQLETLAKSYQQKFISGEDYSIRGLKESFKLSSPHLRHSIRLTVSMISGYLIGVLLEVHNPYWIMLTIVVIMRPSYGLTKERSVKRVSGTVVGTLIAAGIVLLTSQIYIHMAVALISMVFGFSLISRNYFWAAVCITLYVIFAFSLILPDQWGVIQYRLIDTVIGGVVSTIVAYTVLPHWEYKTLRNSMIEVLEANQNYISAIIEFYKNPSDDIEYRLNRKKAFTSTAELHASFKRYTQDPKRRQLKRRYYYEWMTINQNILSTLASLGTYIKDHHHADIKESFEITMQNLKLNLNHIEHKFDNPVFKLKADFNVQNCMDDYYNSLTETRDKEISKGQLEIDPKFKHILIESKNIKQEIDLLEELTSKLISTTNQFL
ncbi:hypothetical protein GO491_01700 [Flavobacteriaceae bacterium Ap0902]|nr:hypothetical protein [Flavobacteriaceae bacterium Ap0902]